MGQPGQPANAVLEILGLGLPWISICVKLTQPTNAFAPILVTVLGIKILGNYIHVGWKFSVNERNER